MFPLLGLQNFYGILRRDPKADYILKHSATLTDLDLQKPPLELHPIEQTQSGPPLALTQRFLSRGEGIMPLPNGEICLTRERQVIEELMLPVEDGIDCITISYTSNGEDARVHGEGEEGRRAENLTSDADPWDQLWSGSRETLGDLLSSPGATINSPIPLDPLTPVQLFFSTRTPH
jgi:hypothetical protein